MNQLKLTSLAFKHNGPIPTKYTCDGGNTSPPLLIENIPKEAESLVLIMDDPDIPDFVKEKYKIQIWDHWIVFNIPPNIIEIKEGKNPKGILGRNTSGNLAYSGPCPPDREHRYFFRIYALDKLLELREGASKTEVEKAMEGHVLAKGELIGFYKRV